MSITPKRVVITGAEGLVGTVLRRGFPSGSEVVPITRSVQPFDSVVADVTDLGALLPRIRRGPCGDSPCRCCGARAEWEDVLSSDVVGTRNVFEAARLAGVRAVVFASSGHVLGLAERESWSRVVLATKTIGCLRSSLRLNLTRCTPCRRFLVKLWGAFTSESFGVRVVCVEFSTCW